MKTIQWIVDNPEDKNKCYPQVQEAAYLLKQNEVIAFPTETVYGLGANAESDDAVAKIFTAKGRPSDNPLIVHIAERSQLENLTESIPQKAAQLIDEFWPGPLTLIFQKKAGTVSELVTAGLNTIAVRMPEHPVALALIRAANLPIAAPSANKSGRPSPTTAAHVLEDLSGKIAGIVDGGATGVGVESTVIDCTGDTPIILRPGGVSKEQIEAVIGDVHMDPSLINSSEAPKSPGMKYTHYAPSAPLYLADGSREWLQAQINKKREEGFKVGVLATNESAPFYNADVVVPCGNRHDLESVARSLYEVLRSFDKSEPDLIFSEIFPTEGVGAAIMNRLEKAAGHKWIRNVK